MQSQWEILNTKINLVLYFWLMLLIRPRQKFLPAWTKDCEMINKLRWDKKTPFNLFPLLPYWRTQIDNAAKEQSEIIKLRLEKLLNSLETQRLALTSKLWTNSCATFLMHFYDELILSSLVILNRIDCFQQVTKLIASYIKFLPVPLNF